MSKVEAAKKKSTASSTPTLTAATCATSHSTPSRIMQAIKSTLSEILPGGTNCQIHNISKSTIIMIPKAYTDGVNPPCGHVRDDLVQKIPADGSIDVNSEDYNLSKHVRGQQMKIHFVHDKVPEDSLTERNVRPDVDRKNKEPIDNGPVRLQGHNDAAVEVVLFHYELKEKIIYLDCEEGGKVKIVARHNKKSTKTVPQDTK